MRPGGFGVSVGVCANAALKKSAHAAADVIKQHGRV
jgi:hypothetical protein